jgi:hypothetical protein
VPVEVLCQRLRAVGVLPQAGPLTAEGLVEGCATALAGLVVEAEGEWTKWYVFGFRSQKSMQSLHKRDAHSHTHRHTHTRTHTRTPAKLQAYLQCTRPHVHPHPNMLQVKARDQTHHAHPSLAHSSRLIKHAHRPKMAPAYRTQGAG